MAKSPLQKRYDQESGQLDKDVAYLDTRVDDQSEQIKDITVLSIPSDTLYAQTVVDANSYLGQAVNFGIVAAGCGCSVAGLGSTAFLVGTAVTVFYEVARAKMKNVNSDSYDGDAPNDDNGTVNLTNNAGPNTDLNPNNYGEGYKNVIENSGISTVLRYVSATQLVSGICTQSCSALYTAQQQALTDYNNAKATGPRDEYGGQSRIVKGEAMEYRRQRWAFKKGRRFSKDRQDRIKNFYPNAGPTGIQTS